MSNLNFIKFLNLRPYIFYVATIVLMLAVAFNVPLNNRVYAQTAPTTSFTLQLDPNTPYPAINGTFNVKLVARSDIEKSNLFSAKITFPSNQLAVQSIDVTNNTFLPPALIVESVFNNTTGQISIVGGVAPAYQTNSIDLPSNMATITFTRLGPDPVTLHFIPSTQSDNNQTGIFSNSTNQNIIVSSTDLSLSDQSTPTDTPTPAPSGGNSGGNTGSGSSGGDGGSSGGGSGGSSSSIIGDIDGNGLVNVFDLSILLIDWNTSTAQADLDHNGKVDVFDLSILLIHWAP